MKLSKEIFKVLLGRRLPVLDGKVTTNGNNSVVRITRDDFGIPYIKAASPADGWYGLGFCQGQDRSFQLELSHRIATGTLSAVFGPDTLPIDKISRRIGFHRSSLKQFDNLDIKTQESLIAFSAGVNDGRDLGSYKKAHEFTLLRFEPSIFTPQDCLSTLKLFAFQMGSNWDSELARLRILLSDGEEALKSVDPSFSNWHPSSDTLTGITSGINELDREKTKNALDQLEEDLASIRSVLGEMGGSNNWALSKNKTTTGRPILANDPHLAAMAPPQWYLASVETPDWKIAGAAIVGLPGFAAGHNGHSAWGVTAGLGDNTDLYIEEKEIKTNHHFIESIDVKGSRTEKIDITVTDRGPIISPSLGFDDLDISIKATWLDSTPFTTLLSLPQVKSFEEFRESWRRWPFSTFNMAYADIEGNIGWQFVGDVPVRTSKPKSIAVHGMLPAPAFNNWEAEPIPFTDLPFRLNPQNGIIATANNKPTNDPDIQLGNDWMDGYRISRIVDQLTQKNTWDIQSCMELQIDNTCLPWSDLRHFISKLELTNPEAVYAKQLLENWDGILDKNSSAASVFEGFLSKICLAITKTLTPHSYPTTMGKGFHPLVPATFFASRRVSHLISNILNQTNSRLDNLFWAKEVEKALEETVKELRSRHGNKQSRWKWGKIRPLTINHPVGIKRPLDKVFNHGPFEWGGDANTVSQAASPPWDPFSRITTIASMRTVMDVGEWDNSKFVLPGGQSGNPASPHYDDMTELWLQGKGVPIHWTQKSIEGHVQHKLELSPHQLHEEKR